MNKLFYQLTFCLLLFSGMKLSAQELRFNQVLKNSSDQVIEMKLDKLGIIWFASYTKGLQRYDGVSLRSYKHDHGNSNSIATSPYGGLFVDADNIIWITTMGAGLERFDPTTNTFTHFQYNAKDSFSLSSDTVMTVLEDHSGNFWVGTIGGLDLLDRKTGKFTHYRNDPNDPLSISHNQVLQIYEDKKGQIWIFVISIDFNKGTIFGSALNRYDRAAEKFTRYFLDSAKAGNGIPGTYISFIYEDIKNNFWITTDAGLYTMDRNTGKCTRYYPDPFNSSTLSQTPVAEKIVTDFKFITEDSSGALWIGMSRAGLNRYDPLTKKSMHYGYIFDEKYNILSAKDTASGLTSRSPFTGISSKSGLFLVRGGEGLYQLNYNKTSVPFYNISKSDANAFYLESDGNILWIGTNAGLLRKDLMTQSEKFWTNDPKNNNSVSHNGINTLEADEKGNLWLGTDGGLDKFEPVTEKFIHYENDPENPGSISNNNLYNLFFDHSKNLWVVSDSGISRMDKATGQFTNYNASRMGNTLFKPGQFCFIAEDLEHFIWASSNRGAFRLDVKTGEFRQYISNSFIKSICVDAKGIVWLGGVDGLYYFNKAKDEFVLFANEGSPVSISEVINIIEDDQKNLWISTSSAIIKINVDRTQIKKFTETNGVRKTNFWYNDNFKAADGRLFLGIEGGYYSFYPDKVSDSSVAPQLSITGFKLGDKELKAEQGGILTSPIWQTTEIRLRHDQNVFSFDFFAVDYITPGDEKYFFMLENYDNIWHDIGNDHRAFFFNIQPGVYLFRVKAVSGDGGTAEKMIRIIITPPWWKTWWAYCLYALLVLVAGYLIYKYQKYYIIKRERERSQQRELVQAKEIEKAYTELKATQAQLIQSEKMASLGELTAGIAHEIQNPLNFVNNFSEINTELSDEIVEAAKKGDLQEIIQLAADIKSNQDKISEHGKRADAIVKGMLQHSRSSSGVKEPTEINKLADEYLRLAYHGLRAKDKNFNATLHTDFDPAIGMIPVMSQDIGRVLLNLINNAFYAVSEKSKLSNEGYEPMVSVHTKKMNGEVEISVADNGNGIPEKVLDKVFQPFFTTKPTGQGTGLGLSLSYDTIKAHQGKINIKNTPGKGAEFIITLPINA